MPLKIKGRLYLLMGSSTIMLAGFMISSDYMMMSSAHIRAIVWLINNVCGCPSRRPADGWAVARALVTCAPQQAVTACCHRAELAQLLALNA